MTLITFSKAQVRLILETFSMIEGSGMWPEIAWQIAAMNEARGILAKAQRAGNFPVAVALTDVQLEALADLMNSLSASGGGPEDVFSRHDLEQWRSAQDRIYSVAFDKLHLRSWGDL